jgi:hypothetical protein
MSDIFISYAREDQARAERLAHAFEELGWSTFWDRRIPPGSTWEEYIGKELEEARCIIVLWSAESVNSHWVRDEAAEARDRKILIPVVIENGIRPPMGFRQIQTADLSEWSGNATAPAWQDLVGEVTRRTGSPSPPHEPPATPAKQTKQTAPRKRSRPKKPVDQAPALQRIVELLDGFAHPRLFLAGNIPTEKLNSALENYAKKVAKKDVLLLYDDTVFGGAQDGLILTSEAVHWRNYLEEVERIRYADIREGRSVGGIFSAKIVVNDKKINVSQSNFNAVAQALAKVIREMRVR